jgi:hypothetical protein
MKYILKDIPSFHLNEEEKEKVLSSKMLLKFDGSYEYLVHFHEKLKYHYYRFQVVRSHLYNLIMKIVYIFNVTSLTISGKMPSFLEDSDATASSERSSDPIIRFFSEDANFISKNLMFKLVPCTGEFIREFLLPLHREVDHVGHDLRADLLFAADHHN